MKLSFLSIILEGWGRGWGTKGVEKELGNKGAMGTVCLNAENSLRGEVGRKRKVGT